MRKTKEFLTCDTHDHSRCDVLLNPKAGETAMQKGSSWEGSQQELNTTFCPPTLAQNQQLT